MKILLTGGGTGGHFYPIIAVAEQLNTISQENRLLRPELYYMSTEPYNESLLFDNNITFEEVGSGKIRRKFSPGNLLLNFFDLFKIAMGTLHAVWRLFVIYPDVVFGKGGYASFPAMFAARFLRIPVVIHESDSKPGKVNAWAGKFARRVAVSYPEAAAYFPKDRTAFTGNPVRKEMQDAGGQGSAEFFDFDPSIPGIFITGGSQGAKFINDIIMDVLPELVKKYQIVHQTGKNNINIITETSKVVLQNSEHKERYKAYPYLNVVETRSAAGMATIIISRAGSTIFEIALWKKPSIIIPIPEPTSHDQRTNAYSYARSGAAVVIEEKNLTYGVLLAEIERIMTNPEEIQKMSAAAEGFARKDSARLIAQEILSIGLEHEK